MVYLDPATHEVYVRERPVRLTPKESALLRLLFARRGTTVRYREICEAVWHREYTPEGRTNVHNLVSRLRQKVDADLGHPTLVERTEGGYHLRTRPPTSRPPLGPRRLIGRDDERDAVRRLLLEEPVRLVTLVGPPGVGKTSLALQVAEDLRAAFADGVALVGLETLADSGLVLGAIAQRLQVRETPMRSLLEGVVDALRGRRLLLVLDNFEHLLGAAPLVTGLLADCAHLKVLVTSRERLRLRWEYVFPVQPLSLPDLRRLSGMPPEEVAAAAAGALFVERARAAAPAFALT